MAFGTGKRCVDSCIEQDIQDGFARRHVDGASAAIEPHLEAAIEGWIFTHRAVSGWLYGA
jgi:hypothetical protein